MPATVSVAAIIISIGLWRIYSNRQYLVELENGKNVLVVGSFRRFQKFYFNNSCYIVKNGQVEKVKAKKRDNIKMLFSQMKRNMIIKKVSENKEVFSIKQKYKEDIFSAGTMPFKYGTMKFKNGKFKKGSYSSSEMSYAIYFKVVKYDIKYHDILPQSILNLLENTHNTDKQQND